MILISNQNQICRDLRPYMASMLTESRRRFFRAKGEITRMRVHKCALYKNEPNKLTSACHAAARV